MDGADTEEDWTSVDGDGEGEGDAIESCTENGSSSSTVSIPQQRKHFPPKSRDIIPGCTVPVEVAIVRI